MMVNQKSWLLRVTKYKIIMQKNDVLELIASMPLEESMKLSLVDDINKKVPIAKVLEKISVALGVKGKLLEENNSEPAKAYNDIIRQYNEEVKKASDEFDSKMEEIDSEAESIDRDVSKQLDGVRVEELEENLKK